MRPILGEGLSGRESKSGRVVAVYVYFIRLYWSAQCWVPLLPATIGHNNPGAAPLLAPRWPAQQPIQQEYFHRYFEAKYLWSQFQFAICLFMLLHNWSWLKWRGFLLARWEIWQFRIIVSNQQSLWCLINFCKVGFSPKDVCPSCQSQPTVFGDKESLPKKYPIMIDGLKRMQQNEHVSYIPIIWLMKKHRGKYTANLLCQLTFSILPGVILISIKVFASIIEAHKRADFPSFTIYHNWGILTLR